MRKSLLSIVVLCLLVAACATSSQKARVRSSQTLAGETLSEGDYPTQRLFRARFDGPEGQGGFKLILRLAAPQRFQLQGSDTLGRALWAVEFSEPRFRFIDYRQSVECVSSDEVPIPEVALGMLPVASLPAVLLGTLPDPSASTSSGSGPGSITDSADRAWTVTRTADGSAITGWTLWVEGEPVLWFQQLGEERILSHREGSQFRWRQVVVEPMDGKLPLLEQPPAARHVECSELFPSR